MKSFKLLLMVFFSVVLTACSSLVLKPADFGWPIESVLKVDNKGFVEDQRYSFILKVKPVFFAEFADSSNISGKEIRIIRDKVGYYFITAANFKNVYVFGTVAGGLGLEEKILVSEKGLATPVFNQKSPKIELIDGANKYLLNNKGIER
jgi:hypothetical protein